MRPLERGLGPGLDDTDRRAARLTAAARASCGSTARLAAGIEARGFGWHDLRHTGATLLVVEEELHPKRVQAWLGHSTPDLALRLYTHVDDDDLAPVDWNRRSRVQSVSTRPPSRTAEDAENG